MGSGICEDVLGVLQSSPLGKTAWSIVSSALEDDAMWKRRRDIYVEKHQAVIELLPQVEALREEIAGEAAHGGNHATTIGIDAMKLSQRLDQKIPLEQWKDIHTDKVTIQS